MIAAARAGKHVLVDKPFAVDAAEAVEMVGGLPRRPKCS